MHQALEALGLDLSEIDGLFVTHVHDDHFSGLTSLIRGVRKLKIFATAPVMATVRFKCAALLGQPFDFLDHLVDVQLLEEDVWNDVDGLSVRPTMSPHPLETTIMFFRSQDSKSGNWRTYAHLADIISSPVLDRFVGENGVSPEFRERVFREYYRPADVKKIDAGGGLIHGLAKDFSEDLSDRLILSHTEGMVREDDEEFGVGVDFGCTDVLIPPMDQAMQRRCESLLERWVPGLSQEDRVRLAGGKLSDLPAGTRIRTPKRGLRRIYMVVRGVVESPAQGNRPIQYYAPGSLLGERGILEEGGPLEAFRTHTAATLLEMPARDYVKALGAGGPPERRRILEARRILTEGNFPGQAVNLPRLDDLAIRLSIRQWRAGEAMVSGIDELHIVMKGRFSPVGNPSVLRQTGNWMNLSPILPFLYTGPYSEWEALEDGVTAVLPGQMVRDVPALGWTLVELAAET